MKYYFNHEKLEVYRKSLAFIQWSNDIIANEKLYRFPVINQLDRASTSIVLYISEGNGKYTAKDKCRYFDIAKASALESASCLDILFTKDLINEDVVNSGKDQLKEIISMLYGLIKSNSERIYEPSEKYGENDLDLKP